MSAEIKKIDYLGLLQRSLKDEGKLSKAYNIFHHYSFSNMMFIMDQMEALKIDFAPIATFNKWKSLGVKVQKGAKALSMCVPGTYKKKDEETNVYYSLKRGWFAMSQTDANETAAKELLNPLVGWDLKKALETLNIKIIPFEKFSSAMGYARKNEIAINPVNPHKHKTTFHEIAHIVLGHTQNGEFSDDQNLTRDIKELEAESVAYLCCQSLELEGAKESRGYIQSWFKGDEYPEASAKKVISAVDKILKAGRAA